MTNSDPAASVPDRLFDDPAAEQRWRKRLTAVRMSLPDPARDAPDHTVYVSNASGRFELVTWDYPNGDPVQATGRSDGTTIGTLSADGRSLWWFDDTDGDEFGSWRFQEFGAGPGSSQDALPGVPPGYPSGVAVGRTLAIAGFSDDDGSRVHLAHDGQIETVYQHQTDGGFAALSHDETLWVLSHSEHGDSRYPALRALRVSDGSTVAELDDTPGKGLSALAFSPIDGDQRLLVGHERRGRDELGIWDLNTGAFTELAIDLPGDIDGDFYESGDALLIVHTHHSRTTLHRYDVSTGSLAQLPAPPGVISGAVTRPDGSVWYRHSSAATSSRLRVLPPDNTLSDDAPLDDTSSQGTVLIEPADGGAPDSHPVTDVWVESANGHIHALLARPAARDGAYASGLLPTVFMVHGGPAAADEDSFDALRATYLDAGIAVVQVNYRGSTGYGSTWRDALTARIGHTELTDIAAVQDHLIITGIVDPDRCGIAGHSWGGFLTLLALGTQQSRWTVGVAGVPVADYLAAYDDEMEPMRAYDRSLFGGSPDQVPDKYSDSSPLNWVTYVRAPVLIMAGENDPRCPIRQIDNYLGALESHGKDYAVYRFNAGHGSMVVDERLRQVALEVDYVRQRLL